MATACLDTGQTLTYKCHPKQKCVTVICIICENAYHKSDFNKLKNTTILSDRLVICNEHDDINITYNRDFENEDIILNEPTRKLIAAIKLKEKSSAKQDFQDSIMNSTKNLSHSVLNLTMLQEDEDKTQHCLIENALLRQLNAEMMEKNLLLKELLNNYKNNQVITHTNYADVLKSNLSTQPTPKIPNLVISAKKEENKKAAFTTVATCLQNNIVLPILIKC